MEHEHATEPSVIHARAIRRFQMGFSDGADALITDEEGVVLAVTGQIADLVARVGHPLSALLAGATSADLTDAIHAALGLGSLSAWARISLADGSTIDARLFTLRSEEGWRYLVALLTPGVDPGELRRLRRTDRLHHLWFERAPSGVSLVDIDGRFLRANPAYCQIVGRSEAELRELTFQQITHPDDLPVDVPLLQDVLAGAIDRYDIDKRYIRPDGEVIWVHLTVALVHDDAGQPLHFVAMVEDITARRMAEDQLRSAMQFMKATFDHTPVAMAELDVEGTIMRANSAAGALVGCPSDALVGRKTPEFTEGTDRDQSIEVLHRLAAGEIVSHVAERQMVDLRGQRRWISVHTAAVVEPGGVADRLVMQVFDITDARELQERLQKSIDELSVAYREKVALMSALSHDLRAPLAAMRIWAELLVQERTMSEADRAEIASRLVRDATRTEGVLADLVASERTPSGLLGSRRTVVVMNEIVERTVELERDHPARDVVVRLVDGDSSIHADQAQLERMVANLVSNAFRHTHPETKVWVTVAVRDDGGDGRLELTVDDDGDGVPDRLKDVIFEPYVRGAPPDRPGTGIGLFLVRQFAELHGGTAVCVDRPGGGARFRVELPRVVPAAERISTNRVSDDR